MFRRLNNTSQHVENCLMYWMPSRKYDSVETYIDIYAPYLSCDINGAYFRVYKYKFFGYRTKYESIRFPREQIEFVSFHWKHIWSVYTHHLNIDINMNIGYIGLRYKPFMNSRLNWYLLKKKIVEKLSIRFTWAPNTTLY